MRSYVRIRFKQSDKKTYTYVCDGSPEELHKNTHAVVDSPYGALTVVEIVKFDVLDDSTYDGAYKSVVAMFNLDAYNAHLENGKRKAALEKELRRRVAKRKLEDNFEALLKDDAEGMKLLAEFKTL